MDPILNHIISFARVRSIDTYLKRYQKAGFVADKPTVRHNPGKRNGFVYFGPDYVEFFWVEDKKKFSREANAWEKHFSQSPRPFGIAFESTNLETFRNSSARNGYPLRPIWSKAPADGDPNDPWWSFLNVPLKYLPGAWTFFLTYLKRVPNRPRTIKIGKNGIFGIAGIVMISDIPAKRVAQWLKFLGGKKLSNSRIQFGPHYVEWQTPREFHARYGLKSNRVRGKLKTYAETGVIHLLAKDLFLAKSKLKKCGFQVADYEEGFVVKPDKRDGYAFLVTEGSLPKWIKERSLYGQKLKIVS